MNPKFRPVNSPRGPMDNPIVQLIVLIAVIVMLLDKCGSSSCDGRDVLRFIGNNNVDANGNPVDPDTGRCEHGCYH
jgi:hypothetical protein